MGRWHANGEHHIYTLAGAQIAFQGKLGGEELVAVGLWYYASKLQRELLAIGSAIGIDEVVALCVNIRREVHLNLKRMQIEHHKHRGAGIYHLHPFEIHALNHS